MTFTSEAEVDLGIKADLDSTMSDRPCDGCLPAVTAGRMKLSRDFFNFPINISFPAPDGRKAALAWMDNRQTSGFADPALNFTPFSNLYHSTSGAEVSMRYLGDIYFRTGGKAASTFRTLLKFSI